MVTNPYNYYIYFPDAGQWVPPRWFNFVFQWAPSPLGTLRWDTTKDPYGNVQFKNQAQPATFICSNTLSDYSGGGAFNVPPSTQAYTGWTGEQQIVAGQTVGNTLGPGGSAAPIPATMSIYQISVSIAFEFTNTSATAGQYFSVLASLGVSEQVPPITSYYPYVMMLVPLFVNLAPSTSQVLGPFVFSNLLPNPVPVWALAPSGINSVTITTDGSWGSLVNAFVSAQFGIVAG